MQQRTRLAIFVVGTVLVSIGGVLMACSDDYIPIPQMSDSGRSSSSSSGQPDPTVSDGGGRDASTADCAAGPLPAAHSGVFCRLGSTRSDDAGYCSNGDDKICCSDAKDSDGRFIKGECVTASVSGGGYSEGNCSYPTDAGGREWHCTEQAHCPQGGTCCVARGRTGPPSTFPQKAAPAGCGFENTDSNGAFVGGSRCRESCQADELVLCAKDSDCSDGFVCRFFSLVGRETGVCM